MKKLSILLLIALFCGLLTGCASRMNPLSAAENLMANITPQQTTDPPDTIGGKSAVPPTDFAVRLFQACLEDEKNTTISPLSVLYALSMTANGANGDTLTQMDAVLGTDVPTRNAYLKAYRDALPHAEKYKLHIANSIWFTDDDSFTVEQDFLQTNTDFYGADIYRLPFDNTALKAINGWVKENTDGMIPSILNDLPPDAVMCLVNAVAFDAEWQNVYQEYQVHPGTFTKENGEKTEVELMYSTENRYLEDENAIGFIKYYTDRKYAFVALLPHEELTVQAYVEGLTGESVASMLSGAQATMVDVAIPKFESTYEVEMSDILASLGMVDAFDRSTADFSGLGTSSIDNIFIGKVQHKTYVTVDEFGTKAWAATAVVAETGAAMPPEDQKEVILDRPFVYMIIDCEANLPLFLGTVMDVE